MSSVRISYELRRKALVSAIVLALLVVLFAPRPVFTSRDKYNSTIVNSGWRTSSIELDGKVTTDEEWSDTTPVDMTLYQWNTTSYEWGPGTVSARLWTKNDGIWLYVLFRVEWPFDTLDAALLCAFWDWKGPPAPLWVHSDMALVRANNETLDLFGWNETYWYNDVTEGSPPGKNNVEGVATHDGTYYWFEFRKMLNSGDGYDWSWTPGQIVGSLQGTDLLIDLWDSDPGVLYQEYIELHLSSERSNSSTLVSCSPNPVAVGSPVTCTATVSGSNPTGTLNWTTSSIAGGFSQSVCTLLNGSCSTFYTDNSTGSETITASYSGDSHNGPSSGNATLTVFINITVGENVTVDPASDLGLTFSNVTAAGNATAHKTSTVQAPLLVNLVGQYYDIRVMAGYSGNVTVSLAYYDSNMTQQQENNLTMMQYTPIPGDVVSYGQVNILDIAFIATRFGTTHVSPSWNAAADINGDGKIDILDISICAVNFGKTAEWTNITTYVDTELNIVRGETTHFSIIGIH